MDVLVSLNSISTINISKPYQRQPRMQSFVSCRATKINVPPIHEDESNLYKILRLSPKSATIDDIKRAYRTMALQYHPDLCHDRLKKEESTRMFVQLNAAYKTLSNPRLKAEYDYEMDLGLRCNNIIVSDDDHESWRSRWMEQMIELNIRSHTRMAQKSGTWGSRMRAQNMKDDHN